MSVKLSCIRDSFQQKLLLLFDIASSEQSADGEQQLKQEWRNEWLAFRLT
jgi:hypothetical protein